MVSDHCSFCVPGLFQPGFPTTVHFVGCSSPRSRPLFISWAVPARVPDHRSFHILNPEYHCLVDIINIVVNSNILDVLTSSASILDSSASILDTSASILDSSASMLDSSDSSLNLSAAPEQAPQQGLLRTLAALKPRTSHHQSKDENLPNPRTKTFRPWFQDESSLDSGASKDDSSLVSSLVWVFVLGFVLGLGLRPWIRPWIQVKSSLDRP